MKSSAPEPVTSMLGLRPLSARSVILSVLLGTHPPQAPVAEIVDLAESFDIHAINARVALTRMVAAGDLERSDAIYRLSPRLLQRQERQDQLLTAATAEPWDHQWHMAVVVGAGAAPDARAALRAQLRDQRLAELREGVWMRPNNVDIRWTPALTPRVEMFTAKPDADPEGLARRLFDLDAWAHAATELTTAMDNAYTPMQRVTVAAATVRHLLSDPLIPNELLDENWPSTALRATYDNYLDEIAAMRATLSSDNSTPDNSTRIRT
ncbi:PaaX domain-containing protein, C- domain protein [Rhodococcus sp. G-MC3]|uniref:PaaX domain-containing protein, C- domain protein n=1 Tax=Rhodococcus sp. G-MC3 TaxID=3046209 RepID=UPI0024B8BA7B|nr:PaaX domain-containing protein, C- domain protein [Rhodococcus sp. G-MC3]MDJ0392640.1 PaaX domain-containing protein, C- domain protein [Rhodococcus sp. G-MC3]